MDSKLPVISMRARSWGNAKYLFCTIRGERNKLQPKVVLRSRKGSNGEKQKRSFVTNPNAKKLTGKTFSHSCRQDTQQVCAKRRCRISGTRYFAHARFLRSLRFTDSPVICLVLVGCFWQTNCIFPFPPYSTRRRKAREQNA